jgi:predicted transcriptional regulator
MNPLLRSYNSRTAAILGSAECEQCGRHITTYSHSESLRGPHFCNDKCKKEYEAEQKAYCPECEYLKEHCKCPKTAALLDDENEDNGERDRLLEEMIDQGIEEFNAMDTKDYSFTDDDREVLKRDFKVQASHLKHRLFAVNPMQQRPEGSKTAGFQGTMKHGILYFLDKNKGARSKFLLVNFPSIYGSSILTYMRREGLIQKESEKATSNWLITPSGKELLEKTGPYTLAMYQKYNSYYSHAEHLLKSPEHAYWWEQHTSSDRDVEHEQVSSSTTEELLARLEEINKRAEHRWGVLLYRQDELREFQKIQSELWNRAHGKESKPFTTTSVPRDEMVRTKSGSKKLLKHHLFAQIPALPPTPPAEVQSAPANLVRPALKFPLKVQAPQPAGGAVKRALPPEKAEPPTKPNGEVEPSWGESTLYGSHHWEYDEEKKQEEKKSSSGPRFAAFVPKKAVIDPNWEPGPGDPNYCEECEQPNNPENKYCDWCQAPMPQRQRSEKRESNPFATKHKLLNRWEDEETPVEERYPITDQDEDTLQEIYRMNAKQAGSHPKHPEAEYDPMISDENVAGFTDVSGEQYHVPRKKLPEGHPHRTINEAPWRNEDIQVRKNGKSHKIADLASTSIDGSGWVMPNGDFERGSHAAVVRRLLGNIPNKNIYSTAFEKGWVRVEMNPASGVTCLGTIIPMKKCEKLLINIAKRTGMPEIYAECGTGSEFTRGEWDGRQFNQQPRYGWHVARPIRTKKAESGPVDHIIIDGKPGEWHVHFQNADFPAEDKVVANPGTAEEVAGMYQDMYPDSIVHVRKGYPDKATVSYGRPSHSINPVLNPVQQVTAKKEVNVKHPLLRQAAVNSEGECANCGEKKFDEQGRCTNCDVCENCKGDTAEGECPNCDYCPDCEHKLEWEPSGTPDHKRVRKCMNTECCRYDLDDDPDEVEIVEDPMKEYGLWRHGQ